MTFLEESFTNKEVIIEVNLRSAVDSIQTQMYEGTFQGVQTLRGRRMYVLKDANYFNRAGLHWDESEKGGEYRNRYIFTALLAIPADSVMHICLARDPVKSLRLVKQPARS
jgi:hypothetical protein